MRLLTRRPGFKAAANGLFSILKDVKLRPRRPSSYFYSLVHEYLSRPWEQNGCGHSEEAPESYRWLVRHSSISIYQLGPVCQAWNQKLAVAEPEFGRGKRERLLVIGLEAIAQKGAREWGNPWSTLYIFRKHPSPLLRKRTFDRQVDCMI